MSSTRSAAPSWREATVRWLLVAMVPLILGSGVVVWLGTWDLASRLIISSILLPALVAVMVGILLPRLPLRARAVIVCLSFFVIGTVGLAVVSFIGNPILVFAVGVVTTGLLLGRRAMMANIAAALVSFLVVGWLTTTGRIAPPPAFDVSPLAVRPWVRVAAVAGLILTFLGFLVTHVVSHIEEALGRCRSEQDRREEAERERAAVQELNVRTQKLDLVGRLAASVAHDLNNSLQVIQMTNEIACDPSVAEGERSAAAGAVRDASVQAGHLVRQLVTLARKETRAPVLLRLNEVVQRALGMLRPFLPGKFRLTASGEGDPAALADEHQLQQVLLNLVVNSRDAMPAGGRISIRYRRVRLERPRPVSGGELPPGDWAALEVEDDGPGMDEETRRRAFEPFFTTKAAGKGTGLGLSTVREIARQSGGQVELRTEKGSGTCVTLWLPAVDQPLVSASRRPESPALAGRTVLLLDDEPGVRRLLENILVDAGCRVLGAERGDEALALLDRYEGTIDLLCTDAVVPGFSLAPLLERFHEKHPRSKVLVCSGYVGEELARKGIEVGKYRLLSKPFSAADLTGAVSELVLSGPHS